MYTKKLPSAALIAHLWEYDPETGDMRWRVRHSHLCAKGVIDARGGTHGYRVVTFYQHTWFQHRLIWKLMTGGDPDPTLTIDHINEKPADNRWCNLRQITRSENVYCSSKFKHKFYLTVQQNRTGRWQARAERVFTREGVRYKEAHHIGIFDTEGEARRAQVEDRSRTPRRIPDNKPKVRRTVSGRWEARVRVGPGKRKHLGTFDTEEEALNAKIS